ncbi:MAG: AmmeMemoRadiSam system radical SAM enzyme, partial [Halofilum sp. (in: g-proteobacteria)]
IRYAYTGNTFDKSGQSTYCHHCGERLIGRDWYELSEWRMDETGHCLNCGTPCSGVFAGPPGHWGRRRQPIRLAAAR